MLSGSLWEPFNVFMLNLIAPEHIGKSVNLIYSYRKHLLKCIEEKLWIHHAQKWWSPYEFAIEFGRSWLLAFDEHTELKDPYHLIEIDAKVIGPNDNSYAGHRMKAFQIKLTHTTKKAGTKDLKLVLKPINGCRLKSEWILQGIPKYSYPIVWEN